MKLLIATTNPGKLVEFKNFLADLPLQLLSVSDLGISEKPIENGETFKANAIIKARFYQQKSGLSALADDGGFEIEALNNQPGVRSHRWVDQSRENEDEELINYTMAKMKHVPVGKRQARLKLVLALVLSDGQTFTVSEAVEGVVPFEATSEREAGFPFRSVLFLPEINKFYLTNQLTEAEREKYNHRRRAVERMKPILHKYLDIKS